MVNIQRTKNLRPVLTKQAMETHVIELVVSHLDYCNTLFIGLPDYDIYRLQQISKYLCEISPAQRTILQLYRVP